MIDHASRPYGQSAWEGKPAGVIGCSIGAIGTAVSQQHLRNSLHHQPRNYCEKADCGLSRQEADAQYKLTAFDGRPAVVLVF